MLNNPSNLIIKLIGNGPNHNSVGTVGDSGIRPSGSFGSVIFANLIPLSNS